MVAQIYTYEPKLKSELQITKFDLQPDGQKRDAQITEFYDEG